MRNASLRSCMVVKVLGYSKFCNYCYVISSRISLDFCFDGVYLLSFLARINWGCGKIIGLFYRRFTNSDSDSSTPLVPQLRTLYEINGENYWVSQFTQGCILIPMEYPRQRYFIGRIPFSLRSYLWSSFWPISLFILSSLTLISLIL